MALRNGTQVHAALVAESGAVLGSTCRFTGTLGGHADGRRRVACSDGVLRYFPERDIHRADECPWGRLTPGSKGR